jgi:hypothetical protein
MTMLRILLGGIVGFTIACASQPSAPPTPSPDAARGTTLEMRVWVEGDGRSTPVVYTLTCDPPGGNHPGPAEACAALEKLGAQAFAPLPPDTMCTQQYGGPMQAHVRGVVRGEAVDARLAYNDGCQISRWDRVAPVVPLPRGERM